MFSRWRERLFFLTADSLVSIDTEGRRLGDHAFLEVDHDGFNMILKNMTIFFGGYRECALINSIF